MPLQNRVTPLGDIVVNKARGLFMGNRGRIHDPETKSLLSKRWALKAWIICLTDFNGRHREVMGNSYTELFFLDEVSALAAGHRPCFECRRQAAKAYQSAFQRSCDLKTPPKVKIMDDKLHSQRLSGKTKQLHSISANDLCDGVMILNEGEIFAVKGENLLGWTFEGYRQPSLKRSQLPRTVSSLTPPATIKALQHGYEPIWHESAI